MMASRSKGSGSNWNWIPGLVAWRFGSKRRGVLQIGLVLFPLGVFLGLGRRLGFAGSDTSTNHDDLVAVATLVLLAASALVLTCRDARRLARPRPDPGRASVWGRLVASRTAVTGLGLVVVLVVGALLAPLVTPYDPNAFGEISSTRYLAPSADHWFGTDQYGRDILARLVYGARVSLGIGFVAVGLAISIGTFVGLLAGYVGGRVDGMLMRAVDVLVAFPRLFLVLLVVGLLQPSIWLVIGVLAATGWMSTARLVRAQVKSVRQECYVQAARALGLSPPRILWRHVLPNVSAPVIVTATLMVGQTILTESALSFLGLGVQVPTPSWGMMIAEGQRVFPSVWWVSFFPGLAITLTVVGYNLIGDALRDAFDPRLRV